MTDIKTVGMKAVALTASLWILGFVTKQFAIPFLTIPAVDVSNLLGLYLGLVVALFVAEYLSKQLKIG